MNPETLLNRAEQAIMNCTNHSAYRYTLYLLRGALFCDPTADLPKDAIKIQTLTRYQIEYGLQSEEWNQLSDKLVKLQKEGKL